MEVLRSAAFQIQNKRETLTNVWKVALEDDPKVTFENEMYAHVQQLTKRVEKLEEESPRPTSPSAGGQSTSPTRLRGPPSHFVDPRTSKGPDGKVKRNKRYVNV